MTRLEAHELGRKDYWIDGTEWECCDKLIDVIFDQHEAELKQARDEIERLNAVIEAMKCCETCKMWDELSEISYQNGCKDYLDYTPKTKE